MFPEARFCGRKHRGKSLWSLYFLWLAADSNNLYKEKYWQKNAFSVNETLLKAVNECKESQGNPKPVAEGSQQQDAEKSLTELMKSRDGQVEDKTLTSKDKGVS